MYYEREKEQLPLLVKKKKSKRRKQSKGGFPYKGTHDPKYKQAKQEFFAKHGNGWWWGWTENNTPMSWCYNTYSHKNQVFKKTAKESPFMSPYKIHWQ